LSNNPIRIFINEAIFLFFCAQVFIVENSFAFVVTPGGIGTLDELFVALTLMQTKMIHHFPVSAFWKEIS
jgi:predicted Rossmann-fold nucleotide-binding protein